MRPATTFTHLALCLGAMTSVAAAWPTWMEDMHLVARQDNEDSGDNADAEQTASPTESADEPEPTVTQATRRLNTATTVDPDAPRKTGSKGNSTEPKEFDDGSPVGSVVMITPNVYLGQALYKAGDFVTWEWNYTYLQAEPTAVDVLLSCSQVTATWTLTANMSFQEVGQFTWDSSVQKTDASQPLLTEEYTLIIKDSDFEITETPKPGYLKASNLRVDIYLPKDYTPLADWNCATCSAASDGLEHKALGFAITMSLITLVSFTWFVTGLRV